VKNYPTPWTVKRGIACHIVADGEGVPIAWMLLTRPMSSTSSEDQAKAATLMAMAPELLKHLAVLADFGRRSDFEDAMNQELPLPTKDEWQAALEDAQFLLAMLAEEGIVAGDIQ
jgi:hypothetical protein